MPSGIYKRTKPAWNKGKKGKPLSKEYKQKISRAHQGKSLKEMGHSSNCPCCICKAKRRETKNKNHNNWKGGSRQYWQVLSRKVWEQHYGRKIPKGGIIHHKDGNWKNIDPENLEMIISRRRHLKWHHQLKKLKERSKQFLKTI